MRVVVWPAGTENDGSARLRLLEPAWALQAQGADVVVDYTGPTVHWSESWKGRAEPPSWVQVLGCDKPDADVVVLQRPGRRWWFDLMPHLQAHGVRVVVDVDDRFDRIHTLNVAYAGYNPQDAQDAIHSGHWIDQACRQADVVTCSTVALADRYGYGHGIVVPNLVPERYLQLDPVKLPETVGWTGSTATHPGDLETTGGVLDRSVPDGWRLRIVGTGKGVPEALRSSLPMTATGWVPFDEYAGRYAELEVAIVPLADTPFNQSKSALKLAEAGSLGVAVIASPTPDNVRLHKHGVGVLANSPAQWRRHLRRLTHNPAARADLAGSSREAMRRHTIEGNTSRWWDAWSGSQSLRKAA